VESMLDYLKEAEDGLADVYRRLATVPPPAPDEIQRDIANVVILLYGLRRNGSFAPLEPHPLVFSQMRTDDRLAYRAAAD